jgi:hypothetical protein
MKLDQKQLKLLGLSPKEVRVLDALREGKSTPVAISSHTKVSRPAIYEILDRLHARGLVKSNICQGKKYWSQANERNIEQELYKTKKQLLALAGGVEEVFGVSDSTIFVHRGGEAIQKVLDTLVKEHSSQRIYMLSGESTKMIESWDKYYGQDKINEFNRLVKKQKLISELVLTQNWFESQIKRFGKKWATDLEGRTAVAHKIDYRYLDSASQIFIFKDSIYFISMNEALIVEVRNSEIQKLVLSMFLFIQDNAKKFDFNEELRQLLQKDAEREEQAPVEFEATDDVDLDRFDSTVLVHKGAGSIRELLRDIMMNNTQQTLYGMQGNVVSIGWNKVFGVEGTNELNRMIKANDISVEAIIPIGWVEKQTRQMGVAWAKDFEGRKAPSTHEIDAGYFDHGGQIFIFNDSVYLMSMNEEVVIEIRNSEIQKLILSMFRFIQDHSRKFDVNERLRELIAKEEKAAA